MCFVFSYFIIFVSAVINLTTTTARTSLSAPASSGRNVIQYLKSRDPSYFPKGLGYGVPRESRKLRTRKERSSNLTTLSAGSDSGSAKSEHGLNSTNDFTTTGNDTSPRTSDSYRPSVLPEVDNNVFKEFMRLSKLTEYMLLDPKFAEDASCIS